MTDRYERDMICLLNAGLEYAEASRIAIEVVNDRIEQAKRQHAPRKHLYRQLVNAKCPELECA